MNDIRTDVTEVQVQAARLEGRMIGISEQVKQVEGSIEKVKKELNCSINKVEKTLKDDIAEKKKDLMWFIGIFVGVVGIIVTIILKST